MRRNRSRHALAEALFDRADTNTLIRAPDGRAPRILVGDGDRDGCERLRRVLEAAGCEVETAGDAPAILAVAERDPPDLVVADDGLLRRDDYRLLRCLRADRGNRWLPVILMTADAADAARRQALDAGADDCIGKPPRPRELLSRVGLHLAMARVGREAIEAVHASEQRLAEVLETIGDAVYATDDQQRVLFANRRALRLWNQPVEAVVGRPFLDGFCGTAADEPYPTHCRVLATGAPAHVESEVAAFGGRWVRFDVHPAPLGGLVVAFRDIDARRLAEARLRDSEERFRLMLEALPDKAFVVRPDGIAEFYNQLMRDYAGVPIGPDPGSRSLLHPAEDRELVDEARARGFAEGEEYTVEARMRRHDGVYRWHRINKRPVRIDGRIAFWLGTAVDIDDMREANALLERRVAERTAELQGANLRLARQIDEREKAEAQLRQAQRIEAVGQLTSGVAHDFNNLLTAIIGNLELLEARLGTADERVARLLAAAASAAERGSRLTAQLLAFSRQQRMILEPVDLNRIVAGLAALLQSTIGVTIRIETALCAGLWPTLADASQMELVLLNLAINARDAMPGEGPRSGGVIAIATDNVVLGPPERAEEPPEGEYAMVSVADTGSGIPPGILDKVFDPFFTTKEVGKGSGLGLSQVLGVAQQLGGGVRIETRAGEGTIVKVYLPHVDVAVDRRQRGRPGLPARSHEAPPDVGLILLVDDDGDVRAVAAGMLGEAGYRVIEAGSGRAALDCLDRHPGQIALMVADVAMPGMSGVELARAARRGRPELPVVFVTGFAGAGLPVELDGSDLILRKPFRAAELAAHVAAALAEKGEGSYPLPLC